MARDPQDAQIAAAARALAAGDVLQALNRVALRRDAPALALRGIAMARLGELDRARELLREAGRAFGARAAVARARCVVAEAEVALAARETAWPGSALEAACAELAAAGDHANAAHARLLQARRLLWLGRLDEAGGMLARVGSGRLPAALGAVRELTRAGIAMRQVRARLAREALRRAAREARRAGIPPLRSEVGEALLALRRPAARQVGPAGARLLRLAQVETLLASEAFIVDACRHAVRQAGWEAPLARRPVLFTLARALGEAWPADAPRQALIAAAFRMRRPDETLRARLRVELGRLRALLRPHAEIRATAAGYALAPRRGVPVVVLAPPVDGRHAAVQACLAEGGPWSSSALAQALGASQRSVQRALEALARQGRAQPLGRGRARRWLPAAGPVFATSLLLPAALQDA